MGDLLRFKRGNKADMPELMQGEPAFVLDEEKLYVGSINNNVAIPSQSDMDKRGLSISDSISIAAALTKAETDGVNLFVPQGEHDELLTTFKPTRPIKGSGKIVHKNAVVYSEGVDFVGLPHNIDEKHYLFPNRINDGDLIDAPLASPAADKGVNIMAHWYNDFGLEMTASSPADLQANGAHLWYDWSWNHTDNPNYDPARHPLLGWYRGDDAKVLDWQCYWLAKYGVNSVCITSAFRTTDWATPSKKAHWIYQLFNNVKNFKSLRYSVWLQGLNPDYGLQIADCNAQQDDMINNVLAVYDNVALYEKGGKKYPIFFIFDFDGFRGLYDNYVGCSNAVARLKTLNAAVKLLGYDGMCIIGGSLDNATYTPAIVNDLEKNGVILLAGSYGGVSDGNTYADYEALANGFVFPNASNHVPSVATALKTQLPHGSGLNIDGSTPSLFRKLLLKAVNSVVKHNQPPIVTIYNVSEWAEGGPGLQPNQKDLFGYLEAVASIPTLPRMNVPVVEVGSNENGSYIKYADGTLICTNSILNLAALDITTVAGALFKSAESTWTYPVPFVTAPSVSINTSSPYDTLDVFPIIRYTPLAGNSVNYKYFSTASQAALGANILRTTLMAIGKWK